MGNWDRLGFRVDEVQPRHSIHFYSINIKPDCSELQDTSILIERLCTTLDGKLLD